MWSLDEGARMALDTVVPLLVMVGVVYVTALAVGVVLCGLEAAGVPRHGDASRPLHSAGAH